jgi:hypothetical protein
MDIPKKISETFEAIDNEVVKLHYNWQMYRQLYGENPERIEILNETAFSFFNQLNDIFYDHIQLSISRLTDPAWTKLKKEKRANLSLKKLQEELQGCEFPLIYTIDNLIDELDLSCEKYRARRNKRIAHLDLESVIDPLQNTSASRAEIEVSLNILRTIMNVVLGHYKDTEKVYNQITSRSGGNILISKLKEALRYRELVDTGKIDTYDIRQSKFYNA